MSALKRLISATLFLILSAISLNVAAQDNSLVGAGSTMIYPLLLKLIDGYGKTGHVNINYQSIGSGAGIALLTNKVIDFAAVDVPVIADRAAKIGNQVIYIPIATGIVAIAYNVPGVKSTIKLNAQVLSGIYSGKITNWNDARITALNHDLKLPSLHITVVYRTDDSGTANIFNRYLNDATTSAKWPNGPGSKSSRGITGLIKQTAGSIGYIALPYAVEEKMTVAAIQNKAGRYISAGNDGYPITGTTGLLVYKDQHYSSRDIYRAGKLMKLLNYVLHQGQKEIASSYYELLSPTQLIAAQKALRTITYDGKPLL